MTQYIIAEKINNKWFLFSICGGDKSHAEQVLIEKQAEYPNKELRIEPVKPQNCWWTNIGTH